MYPRLLERFALRQIGEDISYLVDSRSGDYYELDPTQLQSLRLADGTRPASEIAKEVGAPEDELVAFLSEQKASDFVELGEAPWTHREPHYRRSEPPHLSDVLIEITGRCNLGCRHCFNSRFNTTAAISREMTSEQLIRLVEELDDLNCRRVQLSGGEALMRGDLWAVMDALDEHRIFLDVISTNATLIDEQNAERFVQRFRDYGALYISMDGLTSETYETLRGERVFPKFSRSLRLLTEGGCRVFLNTMAFRQNLHQLPEMYDWVARQPSIKGWRIGLPKVLGRYVDYHAELEVEFAEVIAVFKSLLIRWLKERPGFRLELSDFFRTDSLESGLEDHGLDDNPCKYALTNCTIKPDGTVVFCASLEVHQPAVLGNALSEGLKAVWYGNRHMQFRKLTIGELSECRCCRYRRLCGGGCRSNALLSYGNINRRDPRACEAMLLLEREILPELPAEFRDEVGALIDLSTEFVPADGYRRYI